MIVKIDKGNYVLVRSSECKLIRVVGERNWYSEASELPDQPREYEEKNDE